MFKDCPLFPVEAIHTSADSFIQTLGMLQALTFLLKGLVFPRDYLALLDLATLKFKKFTPLGLFR
jgi:hypothetical protein